MYIKTNKKSIEQIIVILGIITTVLSGCGQPLISTVCSYAMYLFWGAFAFLIVQKGTLRIDKKAIYMLVVYGIMLTVGRLFYQIDVYASSGAGPAMYLPYCVAFYLIGYNINAEETAESYLKAYFFAFVIYSFFSMAMVNSIEFLGKNQAGQVLGCGIIISFFILPKITKSKVMKIFYYGIGIACGLLLWSLHSRTPFVALALVSLISFVIKRNKTLRNYLLFALLLIAIAIFLSTNVGQTAWHEFLQGDQRSEELTVDSVTSGRSTLYVSTIKEFISHPLFGLGAWAYLDCFPLHVLRTGGLFAGLLLLPFVYTTLFRSVLMKKRLQNAQIEDSKATHIADYVFVLALYYFFISLFEGYPPLGPGTSTFFLWIFLGLSEKVNQKYFHFRKI